MKTPREILLARHRAAEPKLDAIRQDVLSKAKATTASQPRAGALAIALTLWRELILPSRLAWSGLAATWILIAMLHAAQSPTSPEQAIRPAARQEMAAGFIEQQKLLGELLTDRTPAVEADRPKTFSPKPRTEAAEYKMV